MEQATCGACEFLFAYDAKFAGRKIRCPKCKVTNELPANAGSYNTPAVTNQAPIVLATIGETDTYAGSPAGQNALPQNGFYAPPPNSLLQKPIAAKPSKKRSRKRKLTRLQEKVLPKVLHVSRLILFISIGQACFVGMILYLLICMKLELGDAGPKSNDGGLRLFAVVAGCVIVLTINLFCIYISFALRSFRHRELGMAAAFLGVLAFHSIDIVTYRPMGNFQAPWRSRSKTRVPIVNWLNALAPHGDFHCFLKAYRDEPKFSFAWRV